MAEAFVKILQLLYWQWYDWALKHGFLFWESHIVAREVYQYVISSTAYCGNSAMLGLLPYTLLSESWSKHSNILTINIHADHLM